MLILADDLGWGALGCYGQDKIRTPHLDGLAKQSMRFTQCYAGSHVCQPSRCVLMTGRHTGHTPVRANDYSQHLRDSDLTLAEVLKARGCSTGMFGKWGLGFEGTAGHPNRQGFDEHFGQLLQDHAHFHYAYWLWHNDERVLFPGNEQGKRGNYIPDEIHARALEFLRANKDRPFFAYLPYTLPHVESVVPEDSEKPYRGQFPKRTGVDGRAGYIDSEDIYVTLAGMISRLDRYVGEVLVTLKELGLDDNTIVIFTSDNGAQNGGKDGGWTAMTDFFRNNGPLRGYKGTWYEGGVRVPLLVRWPGKIAPASTTDLVVGFQDFLPTLAELTGAKSPPGLDGLSFAPTLLGRGEQPRRDGLYWEYRTNKGLTRAARMDRWKAIQKDPAGPIELYDLSTDPTESKNLAATEPDTVRRLTDFMAHSHEPQPEFPKLPFRGGLQAFVR